MLQAGRERHHFGQSRIQREDRRLVLLGIEPAEDVPGRIARVVEPCLHAAADIEEEGYADRAHVLAELGNRSGNPAVEDFEIAHRQVLDEPAFLVADDGGDANELDARLEGGYRTFLGGRDRGERQHQSCRNTDSKDECPPHHRGNDCSKYVAKR